MQDFSCGCAPDGAYHCREHETWPCHTPGGHGQECPPCRLERLASVASHHNPTKTRRLGREAMSLEGMPRG